MRASERHAIQLPRLVGRAGAIVAIGALALLGGCRERQQHTMMEVKRSYAEQFTKGIDFGISGHVRALSFDPMTYELHDIQLEEIGRGLYHAERAEIIVNPHRDTLMLRLTKVTAADSETGQLVSLDGMTTAEVPLGFDVTP